MKALTNNPVAGVLDHLPMPNLKLEEVAKIAGVSSATVSRVINDYPHVRKMSANVSNK